MKSSFEEKLGRICLKATVCCEGCGSDPDLAKETMLSLLHLLDEEMPKDYPYETEYQKAGWDAYRTELRKRLGI